MKRISVTIFIALTALMLLGATGWFLFRYFVTNQIMDKGGMENPEKEAERTYLPDVYCIYNEDEIILHTADVPNGNGRM